MTSSPTPAGASPVQTAGDDTSAYQFNWAWTYAEVYTLNEPGTGFFSIQETVTYTVGNIVQHQVYTCPASYQGGLCTASTPGSIPGATYTTYPVAITGSVTGGSGQADGESVTVKGGTVTGTEYLETSNLAVVEEDQTQNVTGTVSVDSLTLNFTNNEVYTPAQVYQDFRLHNSDSWLESSDVYDNGLVNYSATGLVNESGSADIDTYGPVSATATSTSTSVTDTVNGTSQSIPVDSVNYNDVADQTSETRTWSPTYKNIVTDNYLTGLPQGTACTSASTASCISLTETLTTASTPTPSSALTESITGLTNGLACGGQTLTVSGALSTGVPNVGLTVGVDESTITPDQIVSQMTTTGAGGTYNATITAPALADGLSKPGVNGTFGVEVTSSTGASQVIALEVSPQDCTTTSYTGSTSAQVGTSAPVSAKVTDVATGLPVNGATVVFSMTGQSGTATGTSGSNGVASASLPITATPSVTPYTVTASYAGGPTDAPSSATSPFTVGLDPTTTGLSASDVSATQGESVTFTATVGATGPTSGVLTGTVTFAADGNPIGSPVALSGGTATSAPLNTSGLSLGTHNITATYSGNADYAVSVGSIPNYDVHGPLTSTQTALVLSPSGTVAYGEPVTLKATVTPTVDNMNNAVTFFDGTTNLGSASLSGGSPDTAQITVSSLVVGSHSLSAQYNGDGNVTFAPSGSNPVALTVTLAPTTTTVTLVTPATAPYAFEPATFGITVSGPLGDTATPTGQVQVTVNGTNLGGPVTLTGGTVTVTDPAGLPAGSNSINASYSGDSGFAASAGALPLVVAQATTETSLISSTGNSGSVLNQSVTFTANVAPEGTGNPTGLVTFNDCPTAVACSNSIGVVNLTATGAAGATAQLQLSNLPEGDNYITAVYGGDGNYSGSQSSPPFDQFVSPPPPTAATSTSVVGTTTPSNSSPNTAVYGQTVTFTATVSVAGSQSAINAPSGTVQFSVDGTNLGGPVTLTPGLGSPGTGWTSTASISTTSALAAGGHAVIATYSGLSGSGIPQAFGGSGAIVTEEVQQATTTVTGSPTANPAAYGVTETFTATLHAVAPGAGVPGGTVQFRLDGAPFGSPATVTGGVATSGPAAALAPGTHTVAMVSSGDPNFLGSSGSFTFVVSVITTQTTLSANPNPVIFGNPVTLTATVSHTTGPGNPTGSLTFKDGSTVLATETVASIAGGSSQASFTTSSLAAGAHTITAIYSGDPNFGTSTSSPLVVTVGKQATQVVANPAIVFENLANLLSPTGYLSLQPISATLLTKSGLPIAGQTLVFSAVASPGGPVVCSGVTNAQGYATCTPALTGSLEVILTGGFTATYAGNASYLGSEASAGLVTVVL